ncbi:hypothetical protein FA13DRAFT_1712884 [Coprinellus micaceus]|uniref:Uncharacterized protein n=1 Tax=Coprinellus micaceus TaxID=71717 RepID=A0A4Y7SZH3_COPMI|nr:hypothetical protein FA13DRAFT_1712884 [Coprinellus micaceus]
MASTYTQAEIDQFAHLYSLNIIPLRVILETLKDEIQYIWPQKRSFGRTAYLFASYHSGLVHYRKASDTLDRRYLKPLFCGPSRSLCKVRIYALYDCSKKVAIFNAFLFVCSIAGFLTLLVINAMRRASLIASAIRLPLPGCPAINGGTGWALWLPASGFEFILFAFVVYKSVRSLALKIRIGDRKSLGAILIADNIYYFLGITVILAFNNAMAAGATKSNPVVQLRALPCHHGYHDYSHADASEEAKHPLKSSSPTQMALGQTLMSTATFCWSRFLLPAVRPQQRQGSHAGSGKKPTLHSQDSLRRGMPNEVWTDGP